MGTRPTLLLFTLLAAGCALPSAREPDLPPPIQTNRVSLPLAPTPSDIRQTAATEARRRTPPRSPTGPS